MVFVALPSAYRAPESFAGSSSIIIMSTTIETRHSPNETINTEHENRTIYFPTLDYIPVPENKNVRFWFSYINTYTNTYMHVGISIAFAFVFAITFAFAGILCLCLCLCELAFCLCLWPFAFCLADLHSDRVGLNRSGQVGRVGREISCWFCCVERRAVRIY